MKRIFIFLLIVFSVFSCQKDLTIAVTGVSLDTKSVSIVVGDTTTLRCNVFPKDATNANVVWSCIDGTVARINNGLIEAKGVGQTMVYVRTEEGGFTDSCKVTVTASYVPVTAIELTPATLAIKESDEPVQITVKYTPEDATNRNLAWTSSNNSVATVADGIVVPRKAGSVTITATSEDGPKATCSVTVSSPVASVILNPSGNHNLFIGESLQLNALVLPENADNKNVSWSSNHPEIAKVDTNGNVSAIAPGMAQITVTTEDGQKTASSMITVLRCVDGITLSSKNLAVYEGDESDLVATIVPETASEQRVNWEVVNPDIAQVIGDGLAIKVKGLKVGKTIICVATVDGGKHASCEVSVNRHVSSVKLNTPTKTMFSGQTYKFTATVLPEDAFDKSLIWSSEAPSIVEMDQTGTITAKQSGQAKIKVKTIDGGFTDSCIVTVYKEAKNFKFEPSTIPPMYEGDTCKVALALEPADAYHGVVYSSSDDGSIASASNDGFDVTIIANYAGKTDITAVVDIGQQKTLNCSMPVEVRCHVQSLKFKRDTVVLYIGGSKDTLLVDILPERASNKKIAFESADPSTVGVVPETGVIWPVYKGETKIKATSEDGQKQDSCIVIVKERVKATSIELSSKEIELNEGDTTTLTAVVKPEDTYDKSVTWSSLDTTIATVDNNGLVTAIKTGETNIQVIANGGNNVQAFCKVTVSAGTPKVTSVTFIQKSLELVIGDKSTITATVLPAEAEQRLSWTSSEPSVASVEDGVVTAKAKGSATITAMSTDGSKKSATCSVTVTEKVIKVTSLTLDETSKILTFGSSFTLTPTVLPSNASNPTLTWDSSNKSVATVENGVVTALSTAGETEITATTNDGTQITATCKVKVVSAIIPVTGISINPTKTDLFINETIKLSFTIEPANATNQEVVWSTNPQSKVKLDQQGNVTGKYEGTEYVTVTTKDGQYEATCVLTIKSVPVESISLDKAAAPLKLGETLTLVPTVLPTNATNKNVTWSSGNRLIATVENGIVYPQKAGKVTITATTVDGSKVATCEVKVIDSTVVGGGIQGFSYDVWN